MPLVRGTIALLAWIIIYVPTTLFVVLVMVKNYFGARRARQRSNA
jgi:hypothetical protein